MNNFMLHVPGLGIEAMNAIKSVAEIGSISFDLYTIRTEKTGPQLSALIEPVLGPNPQYLLAGVDNFAYRGDGRLSSAAQMLRPVAVSKPAVEKDDGNPPDHREADEDDF
jgi:hypothetical protein